MSLKDQVDKFRKSFTRQGLDKDDIDIALDLFAVLASLDQALFPGNIAGIEMCLVPSRKKFYAQYCKPVKGRRKEHYTIFVPGQHDLWKEDSKIVFIEENGRRVTVRPAEERRKLTRKEFAVTTAVHEVRHRLQFRYGRRLKKFNAWTWKQAKHPLLRKLGKFVYHLNDEQRRLMIRDGIRKQFARKRTNSEEFDSILVEYLVLHRLPGIRSRDDILKLLKVGPKSVL